MKTYIFQAAKLSKVYGDRSPVQKMIVVVGAASKSSAKEQAVKCAIGLRIVNAGNAFKDEAAAMARVDADRKLTESLLEKGFTQFGPVAELTVINMNTQRGIAKLLGM